VDGEFLSAYRVSVQRRDSAGQLDDQTVAAILSA
jgi:hypothetical protein